MTILRRTLALALLALLPGCVPLDREIFPATRPATSGGAGNLSPAQSPFINARAIILVRHADITIADKKTKGAAAPLTPRGEARAKELAFALKDANINRIITSDTLRTQQTAAALAEQLHLTLETPFSHGAAGATSPSNTPTTLPASTYTNAKKKEAADVFAYLAKTAKPTDTLLLVHHHSVLPGLLELLTAHPEFPFAEDTEFDRLYLILPNPTTHTYQILRLRYGGTWETANPE